MAEPGDRGTVFVRVDREYSVSRLEKQLLVKVYGLLVPAAQVCCTRSWPPRESVFRGRLIGSPSHNKGV